MSTVETAVGRFVWHDHISDDPAAASGFYEKLLGWEIEIWKPGEIDYPMIKVDEQTHGGFGPAQGGAPPHWLAHVIVDDVDLRSRVCSSYQSRRRVRARSSYWRKTHPSFGARSPNSPSKVLRPGGS